MQRIEAQQFKSLFWSSLPSLVELPFENEEIVSERTPGEPRKEQMRWKSCRCGVRCVRPYLLIND